MEYVTKRCDKNCPHVDKINIIILSTRGQFLSHLLVTYFDILLVSVVLFVMCVTSLCPSTKNQVAIHLLCH